MEKATHFRNISSLGKEGDYVLLLNRVGFARWVKNTGLHRRPRGL
jgi:hypothetical protein